MTAELVTPRLRLRPLTPDMARGVLSRLRTPDWAEDYPTPGDLASAAHYLELARGGDDPQPFGAYQVLLEGRVVGGAGFHGPPRDGVVTIGYGLAPSAQGEGYATEALLALLDLAAHRGMAVVRGDTAPSNLASQRVMEKAGMRFTTQDEALRYYEWRPQLPPT